ncbi:MAG: Holliday junction resolvase RuvX [Candidatus Brocadiaceae bacterium]|nr:Holliday junction resolvase RuvX [Candidatus Brocadiaceae bacterium]
MERVSLVRIMRIDYGEKRIGIAISDLLGISAQGLPTIERSNFQKDIQKILNIIHEKE